MRENRRLVQMRLGPLGRGSIVVDGIDLARYVRKLTFTAEVRDVSVLTLELAGLDVEIDAENIDVVLAKLGGGTDGETSNGEDGEVRYVTDSDTARGGEAQG